MVNMSSLSILLIHFEAIYRYEGVRSAAYRTGIPLCRLSKSLNDLEAILNRKLFYSDKNSFRPTKEGQRLYADVDINSAIIKMSNKLNDFSRHEVLKACVLPQIRMNLSGEIILNHIKNNKKKDNILSVTITSEHFDEREVLSQLRACDLDMVLSYCKFESKSIENHQLYVDQYSFYQVTNESSCHEDIQYLAMLDLGSDKKNSDNLILEFIEMCTQKMCLELKNMPRLVLPDAESLLDISRSVPLTVVLNNASYRAFSLAGIKVIPIPNLGKIELPVYMSYHKMNPKKSILNTLSNTYVDIIYNEAFPNCDEITMTV